MDIFLFCFLIFYFWLSLKKEKWALFLILALLPLYQVRFKLGFIPLTLLELMISVLFISWFLVKTRKNGFKNLILEKWQELKNWRCLIIVWLCLTAVAVFIAPDKRAAAGIFKAYFLEPILFLIVLVDSAKGEEEKNLVFNGLILSAFYLSLMAVWQRFFGGGVLSLEVLGQAKVWRATSLFTQPNFLGLYLGPIVLLTLSRLKLKGQNKFKNLFYLLTIALSVLAIIFARSEGALIGVFSGLLFFGLVFNRTTRRLVLAVLLILMLFIFSFPWLRQYSTEKVLLKDLSGQLRLNIWQGAISLLKTSPLLGVGLSGYQKLIPKFQKPYYQSGQLISVETHPYPHNLYLAVWLELGLLGLLVFISLIVNFFVLIFKKIKRDVSSRRFFLALGAAMIVLLVHGLVDTPYFKNDLSVLFWLIIGLGIAEANLRKGG